MRILITGASGNLGRGMSERLSAEGHELVLADLHRPQASKTAGSAPFVPVDVQTGVGLDLAAADCDLVLHLPAWHGIHVGIRSEIDFWRLNVDGTFWMFQAALAAGIKRVVFLSSQSWHRRYDKYGFTKRIGEDLCEYYLRNHGIRFVAVRPADFTPTSTFLGYGVRLLYGGVDRADVIEATTAAIRWLLAGERTDGDGLVVDAVRPNAFAPEQLERWEQDPVTACLRIFGGAAAEMVEKYGLAISRRPMLVDPAAGADVVGYLPRHHFGTFLDELRLLDQSLGRADVQSLPGPT